jgi:TolB-like protein
VPYLTQSFALAEDHALTIPGGAGSVWITRERPAAASGGAAQGPAGLIDLAREADFSLGGVRARPQSCEIETPRTTVRLQPRVMQVLVALARAEGSLVTRDVLSQSCWGGLAVSEDAVNRCIQQLRRLAEGEARGAFSIETFARLGYRLVSQAADRAGEAEAHVATLAVLPFVNLSSDPDQELFSDGLSEELRSQLARLKRLGVAARSSCFAFKGQSLDVRLVGARLGVALVLEGSVRRAGDRLRITTQLISCADGYHRWSDAFDRRVDDAFEVQQDVARAVTRALGVALGVAEAAA